MARQREAKGRAAVVQQGLQRTRRTSLHGRKRSIGRRRHLNKAPVACSSCKCAEPGYPFLAAKRLSSGNGCMPPPTPLPIPMSIPSKRSALLVISLLAGATAWSQTDAPVPLAQRIGHYDPARNNESGGH